MLAQKAGAGVLKVIDSPAWYTSWTGIFFFFFLKRNDLVVAIFFSRAITFCVHDIFEKRKKRKTQIPFNRWYIPIFFIKITYKTMRLFLKKFDIFIQSILVNEIKHEIIRVLGIGICFNLFRRFETRGTHWEHVQVWQDLRPRNLSTMTSLCLTMSWTLTRFEIMNTCQLISAKTREEDLLEYRSNGNDGMVEMFG